jgi:hypothetical protein
MIAPLRRREEDADIASPFAMNGDIGIRESGHEARTTVRTHEVAPASLQRRRSFRRGHAGCYDQNRARIALVRDEVTHSDSVGEHLALETLQFPLSMHVPGSDLRDTCCPPL